MQEMTRRDFLKGAAMAGGAVMLGGLHGLGRVQAAGTDAKVQEFDPLLDGVYDIHMHLAPDVKERCTDEYTFARNAQAAGYRAVMYKTNEWSCHDRAYLIRQALPGFEVFGSFCMNFTYGDKINVYAAKMAAATTGRLCRCIWMPTQAAVYQFAKFGQPGRGIPVTGRNGKLLPEVVQVMEICAENGMIFATGHSAPEESILMAQKAHEMGFKKLVITHPNTTIWQMTADQIKRCADYGAYIEYCYLGRLWGAGSAMPDYERQSAEEFLNYVRLVPERSFITTDLGQPGMPDPIDGMRTCIKELQSAGVPQRTIDILVRKNPAYLLGLEGCLMGMTRREFLKNAAMAVAAGAMMQHDKLLAPKKAEANEPGSPKNILNYNPNMQYRPMGRTGVDISALGFGMLRLPMLADGKTVDMDQTVRMVRRAIEGGVNYIDTGYVYLGGQSQIAVGKALAGGLRDRVYVTNKAPWWIMERPEDFERMFDESRKAMNTDVIDFYHIHIIMHRGWKEKVIPFRLIEKIEKLKAQGKIRFSGFSFHDRLELFKKVVEANPNWDFCLIQHNYLDYEYEAGVLGPKYAAANGMGLAVMKPARTGFLANLPDVMRKALASTGVHKPDNEWALDYLWDIPEVSVAVSGMGSMKDVEENLKYAAKAKPNMLTPAEREALGNAIRAYREAPGHVDCTGCYKCIPCPNNVAIGYIFAYVYNNYLLHKNMDKALFDYTVSMSPIQRGAPASACNGCGQCLAKCPQGLNVPEQLKKVAETFGF